MFFISVVKGDIDLLEMKNLTKKYGDKTAVDHLTFSVSSGEVFGY